MKASLRYGSNSKLVLLVLLCLSQLNLSCANVFSEMAIKDTDKAKLYEANKLVGRGDWDGALLQINGLTAAVQATREVKSLSASAYAGKCGLDFMSLLNSINTAGSNRFFQTLANSMKGTTPAKAAHCYTAEQLMLSISSSAASRTSQENLFLSILELARIGAIVAANGDVNADGTLDVGYDPCTSLTSLPVSDLANKVDANNLVVAIAIFSQSIVGLTGAFATSAAPITAACAIAPLDVACSLTSVSQIPSGLTGGAIRAAIRAMLSENANVGLGTCTAPCVCDAT
jgi:hypothetical protein